MFHQHYVYGLRIQTQCVPQEIMVKHWTLFKQTVNEGYGFNDLSMYLGMGLNAPLLITDTLSDSSACSVDKTAQATQHYGCCL